MNICHKYNLRYNNRNVWLRNILSDILFTVKLYTALFRCKYTSTNKFEECCQLSGTKITMNRNIFLNDSFNLDSSRASLLNIFTANLLFIKIVGPSLRQFNPPSDVHSWCVSIKSKFLNYKSFLNNYALYNKSKSTNDKEVKTTFKVMLKY